jgi:endonuclease/exonuclease/phosphatase family metal-dependent hydrolase
MATVIAGVLLLGLSACDRQPEKPAPIPFSPTSAPAASPHAPVVKLTPAMTARAAEPAGIPTGLFIDRPEPGDLRVMSYNIHWDDIFPDVNADCAEKFQRVVKALAPDVLALQEIGDRHRTPQKDGADVKALMDAIDPRPGGETWHVFKGHSNVIVSRYPLSHTSDHTVPGAYRDPACALVDLPDERFAFDLYVLNNHFKCCSRQGDQKKRQAQADALVNWIRDARTPGGEIDLLEGTPIILVGDFNLVEGLEPLNTILSGDISDKKTYGPDFVPDWDDSELTAAHPLHNLIGPDDYTWRDDGSDYQPTRMDWVIYTDSLLDVAQAFILNTTTLSKEELAQGRLEPYDVTLDMTGVHFDHLPVVVDFRPHQP